MKILNLISILILMTNGLTAEIPEKYKKDFQPDIYITKKTPADKKWLERMKPAFFEQRGKKSLSEHIAELIAYYKDGIPTTVEKNKLGVRQNAIDLFGGKEVTVVAEDGFKISSMFYKRKDAPVNILYATGYFEQLTPLKEWCTPFAALFPSFNIFSFDWRAHGDSDGDPKKDFGTNAYKDIHAALEFIRKDNDKPIVLVGFCMGGAMSLFSSVMAQAKGIKSPDAIVLSCPFTDFLNVVRRVADDPDISLIEWLATRNAVTLNIIMNSKARHFDGNIMNLRPDELVSELDIPVCIEHSTADTMMPISEGMEVFKVIKGPKMFMKSEIGRHVRMHSAIPSQYRKYFYTMLTKFNLISENESEKLQEEESKLIH